MVSSQTQKTEGSEAAPLLHTPLIALYLALFFFALHFALPLYVGSSLLAGYFNENLIGFLYAVPSLILLFLFARMPSVLRRFGVWRITLFLALLEAGSVLGLAYSREALFLAIAFIANQALVSLLFFNFDVFVESFSKDETTGAVRGTLLTVFNTAVLLGPFLAGLILTDGDYYRVYLASLVFLLPAFWILLTRLDGFKEPAYTKTPYKEVIKEIFFAAHPRDAIRHALTANLLMRFFFSWMVIYTPLYLHGTIGFSWSEIGIIFTVMLLPFVLFEAALGKIADARGNERMLIGAGFLITAFFTALLALLSAPALAVWAAALFGTRVGMSFVEVASESYFFKHITSADAGVLSVFRNANPVAYLVGPAAASVLLFVFPLRALFVILALVMLYGAWDAYRAGRGRGAR